MQLIHPIYPNMKLMKAIEAYVQNPLLNLWRSSSLSKIASIKHSRSKIETTYVAYLPAQDMHWP